MRNLMNDLQISLRFAVVTIAITGLAYPFAVLGAARVIAPEKAEGSLLKDEKGTVIGSALLAQRSPGPAYFEPRPSAAGAGWDAASSGGSNLGPTSRKLRARVEAEIERLRRENPSAPLPIPAELVTASASGLDPHLSPAGARWQLPRVAAARGVSQDRVAVLLDAAVEGRTFGVLGEPRVNVLLLNLALDRELGRPR